MVTTTTTSSFFSSLTSSREKVCLAYSHSSSSPLNSMYCLKPSSPKTKEKTLRLRSISSPIHNHNKPLFNQFSKTKCNNVFASHGNHDRDDDDDDVVREECGVVGIYGDPCASNLCYLALQAIQHRGQDGAGMVTVNNNKFHSITDVGLVSNVFDKSKLEQLPGKLGIGHVRYSTTGVNTLKNVQPFVAETRLGPVAVAHNGNLTNYRQLKEMLQAKGCSFNTSSDTEAVLHLIGRSGKETFLLQIIDACEQLVGAYSMVFLTENKLIAVRDPRGFRPLVMGRRSNGSVVFASETCAFDLVAATYEREVEPGEIVVVERENDIQSFCLLPRLQPSSCIFEHIYFSQSESVVFGHSVYKFRYQTGQILAAESPVDCDVVIPVPDSGCDAAQGYASKAGVEYQMGLRRRANSNRTFIEPIEEIRGLAVKLKLAPVKVVLEGKRVVVVDDSVVRGTTARQIVRMIREAGAKEVHLRIACPPIVGPCYYGVNIRSSKELISSGKKNNVEEMRQSIGCDSLAFLSMESLKRLMGDDSSGFCYACFTKEYPIPPFLQPEAL